MNNEIQSAINRYETAYHTCLVLKEELVKLVSSITGEDATVIDSRIHKKVLDRFKHQQP